MRIDVTSVPQLGPDALIAGGPDNTAKFNKILASLTAPFVVFKDYDELYFPPGNYYFKSQPQPISRPVILSGDSMSSAVLVRDYNPGANSYTPFISLIKGTGSRIENLSINANTDTVGGLGLLLESQPYAPDGSGGFSPDFTTIRNVNISQNHSSGKWHIALRLNGSPRRVVSGKPAGLRDITIDNVYLFASLFASLELNTVHDAYFMGSCYPAGGTTNRIIVNGWQDDPCVNIICETRQAAQFDSSQFANIQDSVFVAPYFIWDGVSYTGSKYVSLQSLAGVPSPAPGTSILRRRIPYAGTPYAQATVNFV